MRYLIATLLCVIFTSPLAAQYNNELVTINLENAGLNALVREIELQTKYRFYYDENSFKDLVINISVESRPVNYVLDLYFKGPQYYYGIDENKNVFLSTSPIKTLFASQGNSGRVVAVDTRSDGNELAALRERKIFEIGVKGLTQTDKQVVLSGYVRTDSGEPVPDAAVKVDGSVMGAVTDNSGYYTVRLSPGKYVLTITSVGFVATRRTIQLYGDGALNIELQTEVTRLQEVVVSSERNSNTASLQLGSEKLNMQTIKIVPATFGESDVLKAILTLPGVKTVGEASTGFNVRGGAADQNLILYNGSTIYNPFHFFGFFSAFNPELVEGVELFKGSVPSMYGGRLASVLNVTGKRGDGQKIKGSAGIGVLTSRINLEGPILKDRLTFNVGARTTYSNWVFRILPESSGYRQSKASFTDFNLSLDYDLNENNSFQANAYYSDDQSNLNTDTTFTYTNRNFSFKWKHEFSDKLSASFHLGHDHFDYGNFSSADTLTAYTMRFAIDQANFQAGFTYDWNEKHNLSFGLNSIYYRLDPGSYLPRGTSSIVAPAIVPREQAIESALYIEDNISITRQLSINAGLRYSIFQYLGSQVARHYAPGLPRRENTLVNTTTYEKGEVINTYQGFEPRLSARYLFTEKFSIKAGYTVMRQYIHMLSNTVSISPTDIWKLSDPNIKPQFSEQVSLGLYKTFGQIETSIEGYTKRIENYLDYKSGAVLIMNPAIEQATLTTRGKAYGLEFSLKKPSGKLNGWISYTYSRILLRVDDPIAGEQINRGNYYPASYDKPHDFNFTGNQKLSKRFNVSMNVTYSTGRPVTIPIGVFNYGGAPKTLFSTRNSYRIPDYFRMDISLNLEGNHKVKQKFHNSWTFGVYNLTGRRNPYSVFFTKEGNVIKGYKLSIFGSAIPFINFNIRF